MSDSTLVVYCTCPDGETAERLAEAVVAGRLAACVNLLGPVRSVYRWEGRVERAQEMMLIAKTTAQAYPALEDTLRRLHPYDVPEIVALPIVRGLQPYLEWVEECTSDT